MAYSTQRAVSDGTMAYLDVSIQYMKRADISVFYNDLPANPATWAWVGTTDKRIAFTPNVPNGVEVLLKRSTQINTIINVFSNGAKFNNATMDQDFTQLLYLNQEAVEGAALTDIFNDVDFHGYKIKNVGLAVDDTDVVSFGQLKTMSTGAYAAQLAAEAARDLAQKWASQLTTTVDGTSYSAKQYALNSGISAAAALGSQNAAAAEAAAASGSASAASASASSASSSQSAASASAGAAGTSETNAGASATLAQRWASLLGSTVDGTSYSAKQYAMDAAGSAGANVGKYNSPLQIYKNGGNGALQYFDGSVGAPGSVRWQVYLDSPANGAYKIGRYDVSGTLLDSPVSIDSATGIVTLADGLAMNAKKITGVADPIAAQDAATKAYVDVRDGRVLVASQTANATTGQVFLLPAGYDNFELVWSNLTVHLVQAPGLGIQFSFDGGITWQTSTNYQNALTVMSNGGTLAGSSAGNADRLQLFGNPGNAASNALAVLAGDAAIMNVTSTKLKVCNFRCAGIANTGTLTTVSGVATQAVGGSTVNAIRLINGTTAGQLGFDTGNFSLYGYNK